MNAWKTSGTIILIMAIVFVVNLVMGGFLNRFGVIPRTTYGLPGVLFSPLLHGSFSHLLTNALSLYLLLVILYSHKQYKADQTLIMIWIICGVGTWLIGRAGTPKSPIVHIGASGLIYGLVVYLIVAAWWLHSWRSFFMALLVLFFYGGIFYGVLPQRGVVSWEGHLSGAIAGLIVAYRIHA